MTVGAIVAAAGRGERLGAAGPKALVRVGGMPLVTHAVRVLLDAGADTVVVAAPADHVDTVGAAVDGVPVVTGGATRQESVRRALWALPADVELVLVHDAARAFAPPEVVTRVIEALTAGADAVVPVLPLADTVKEVDGDGRVVRTLARDTLRAVQTPQGFRRAVLERAHASAARADSLDDAALVEALGITVVTVPGADAARKVTTPADLLVVEAFASGRAREVDGVG